MRTTEKTNVSAKKKEKVWKSPHPFQSWTGEAGEVQADAHGQVEASRHRHRQESGGRQVARGRQRGEACMTKWEHERKEKDHVPN